VGGRRSPAARGRQSRIHEEIAIDGSHCRSRRPRAWRPGRPCEAASSWSATPTS
jgi:hypothetical protein